MSSRVKWLIATVAAASCIGTGWAQSAANPPSASSSGLEEIVVTSRKVVERIEDVPLAIRSFDTAELAKAGQGGLVDIAQLTPGFVFQTYSSSFDASPTVRGLSQFDITSPVANVSTVVDGVYIPRNYSVDLTIADINRVEVVKGPQSALYGSNAFAGVISYTLAPAPAKPEAEVSVTGGTAGRIDTKFAAGDSWFDGIVSARANYATSKFDGTWGDDFPKDSFNRVQKLGGHDNQTYGGEVRIDPIKQVELNFDYFHLDRREDLKPGYNITNTDPQNQFNCAPFVCGTLSWNPATYQSAASTRPPGLVQPIQPGFTSGTNFFSTRLKVDLTEELHFNYTYGWVGSYATEITTSSDNPVSPTIGLDYTALFGQGQFVFGPYNQAQKEGALNQLGSHELRLDWDHGPIKALVGFYSAHDTDHYEFSLGSFLAPLAITGNSTRPFSFLPEYPFTLLTQILTDKTTAEFGRIGYDFLDAKANLALELRHSADDLASIDPTSGASRGKTFDETTPRLTASYKLTRDNLLYVSGAEGVKQGGFNPTVDSGVPVPAGQQTFAPEKNWTFELGTKNTLFDGRGIVNADIFLVKWNNLQIQEQPSNAPAGVIAAVITVNLGSATSKGFESDGRFAVNRNIDLTYALSLLDATFDSGDTSGRFIGLCNGKLCPTNGAIGGNELPRASKVQAAGGATWKDSIGGGPYSYAVHGEFTYQSQQQVEEMNLSQIPSRFLVNANISLRAERWDLTLWGRNILDKKYVADSFFIAQASFGSVGYGMSLGELATEGLTFTAHF